MKIQFLLMFFGLSMAAILSHSCSETIALTNTSKPNRPTKKFEKILVVGLTKNNKNRSLAEQELVLWLRQDNFQAIPSVDFIPVNKNTPTREDILPVVTRENIDAVLTMKLIGVKNELVQNNVFNSDALLYEYLKTHDGGYVQGYYRNEKILVLECNLYDVNSEKIVFTGRSETFQPQSEEELERLTDDYARSLSISLKKSKLLVPAQE